MPSKKVAVLSLFRNRSHCLRRYRSQLESITSRNELYIVAVEGDSQDDTPKLLNEWAANDKRVKVIHRDLGYPDFGSVVNNIRFKVLTTVANLGLSYIAENLEVDYVLWLESDLIYQPGMLDRLIADEKPAIAPMIWVFDKPETRFYDIWAYRHEKGNFPPHTPAWYAENYPKEPFEIRTAGSVILAEAKFIYDGARFDEREAIVSYCENLREKGATIWCDPKVHVQHPWPR